ncbi:ABC transporter substrate-binding protein [Sansalvadorimonas sp. 2012CJ34-2]|uniref:ABC transporter substrate-binding protein n=1 Tax=Parendozoicomonas callyspongiae TaxID=2942213 RepID=A0ABT0PJI7_9GAMM|nr:ABC transporter substrate-binding protein [Sansalvadorimonas sp. 2012CJ34-2]MCL6271431.1 ABC transporter substrate-binding protein [Sansalvadorimonas sp. 2012CJ34-2]
MTLGKRRTMPAWSYLRKLLFLPIALLLSTLSFAADNWNDTLKQARGQTVYFNAWGGSEEVNDYLNWAARELKSRYGIKLQHVKVDDISTVVSRILTEKSAGRSDSGSVDMMWINGENFKSMKQHGLLYGPFVEQLPSWKYVDTKGKPTTLVDFTEPVEGLEAPWGMAQLVFMHDTSIVPKPPKSMKELFAFSQKNPGLFTYPAPPDFVGTTFLKQAVMELTEHPELLQKPVTDGAFDKVTKPLWAYLDQLHPLLWRKGRTFPTSSTSMLPLLDDGEIGFSLTFNPNAASTAINNGLIPETVRTYVHDKGTIANSHFLAIPFNSSSKAGAQVAINFLMSPEAQIRKANPQVWGDPTVLAPALVSKNDQKKFAELPLGVATLRPEELGTALPEPHSSWVNALEQAWQRRYR